MTTRSIELHDAIAPLAPEWDELVDRAGAGPFSRPGWFEAWWQSFGRGRLEIATLRRDGELAAVLPLARRHGMRKTLTNWHTPEFEVPALDPPARTGLLRSVLQRTRMPIAMGLVTAGRADTEAFTAAARAVRMPTLMHTVERSPFVRIDGGWEHYQATLPRRRRSELRRRRRRLQERGALTLEIATGEARLTELLEEGFAVETSGWKARAGTAIVSRADTQLFYRRVAEWAAERGWLRLAFLRLDERPLAFHFTLEDGVVAYQLKGGYDPAFRELAPGTLLIHDMLEWAFATGLHSYEFLGADEDFKLDWTSGLRDRLAIQAFPHSPAGAAGWCAYAYGRPAAKRARDLVRR
jgi:CelD/BcsL family acetyltransferase involved in cellulose biosynthesis